MTVELKLNPTRTLASLVARFGGQPEFAAHIAQLDALAFFGRPAAPMPLSLDGQDNYLPEDPLLADLLPADPFVTFMAVYLPQLRAMVARALMENPDAIMVEGTEVVFASGEDTLRLDWGNASVPQIETYFERFHSKAAAAVRGAATSIIDADTSCSVRLYPVSEHQPGVERTADALRLTATVGAELNSTHRLVVYAKTETRIRFEVRRVARARTSGSRGLGQAALLFDPLDRGLIYAIIDVPRHDARRLVRWRDLFEFFDEPDRPAIGDLVIMMTAIARAADGSTDTFNILVSRLAVDGGLAEGVDERIPIAAVQSLVRAGIIERGMLRHRHRPGQIARYRLTPTYRWLREALLRGLQEQESSPPGA